MSDRIIVFSSHTIFTEGIVSRLREHDSGSAIHFLDAAEDDFIEKVSQIHPSIVVIDYAESSMTQMCLLCDLLNALPHITILRLKVHENDVQVISSSPHVVNNVHGLINLIEGGLEN